MHDPNSVSDSHFSHMEVSKVSKDDSSQPLSLAEKKLQRLARSRATASVSRSRKREHLHSLQTRLSALEQENKDLVQQIALRDAELKRFRQERDCVVVAQPEPATEQVQASSPREIIVCPATSALPRILCNPAGLPNSTQQQPQACWQDGASSSLGMAGSQHQVMSTGRACTDTEPAQTLSLQQTHSASPSADHDASTPTMQVKQEPGRECLAGPAQQQTSVPALGRHTKQQASFSTITSGEYSHLTMKRQLSIKTAQPVVLTQQLEMAPAVNAVPHEAPPCSIFPAGDEGFSAPDLHTSSSHSFDSCHLPVSDMPDFDFEAGNALMPEEGFWKAGQDAQLPHDQVGSSVQAVSHCEAGSLAGPSRSWDWCSVMAHSLEQPPPSMPDLHPLPDLSNALCTSWEQQAWQVGWQHQQQWHPQGQQQQQQQQQFQPSLVQFFEPQPTYSKGASGAAAAAGTDFMDFASDAGVEASWMTLPSCSLEHMLQSDAAFATGEFDQQKAAAGKFQCKAAGGALASCLSMGNMG